MTIEERMNFIKDKIPLADYIRSVYKKLPPVVECSNYIKTECCFPDNTLCESRNVLTISKPRQIFYCFGCNRGGDIISFVSLKEEISQFDALIVLEKYYWKQLVNKAKEQLAAHEPYEDVLKELLRVQDMIF